MRKILLAGVLAALALTLLPDRSHAGDRYPNNFGFGWLQAKALRKNFWIHQNGPLFNYGPYNTPGLVYMHIPQPYHGTYTPADPTLWNQGGFYSGAPVYGAPPAVRPVQQPANLPATVQPSGVHTIVQPGQPGGR